MKLDSNFTYFRDFPIAGDQFQQRENRNTVGLNSAHSWFGQFWNRQMENAIGFQMRYDNISPLGIFRTQEGAFTAKTDNNGTLQSDTIRRDIVNEYNISFYAENRMQWFSWFRSVSGLRNDFYHFDVASNLGANSGKASANMISPKLALVFGPWAKTEFYLNGGGGFHSNDARGITSKVDPNNPTIPIQSVTPLVRTWGYETGFRTGIVSGLQSSVSLWQLLIDSELLFIGDSASTEATRPSRRSGIEFTNYWNPINGLVIDTNLSLSRAHFRDANSLGNFIPGSMQRVASIGVSADKNNWFGTLRMRHFGPRPLVADNSQIGSSSVLVNMRAGYRFTEHIQVSLDVFNLIDSKPKDIQYFYSSQLRNEVTPAADRHSHPSEPRNFRFTVRANF